MGFHLEFFRSKNVCPGGTRLTIADPLQGCYEAGIGLVRPANLVGAVVCKGINEAVRGVSCGPGYLGLVLDEGDLDSGHGLKVGGLGASDTILGAVWLKQNEECDGGELESAVRQR